jgi:hypothetical protein
VLKASLESWDTKTVCRKLAPRRLSEEVLFLEVALLSARRGVVSTSVLDNTVAQDKIPAVPVDKVDDNSLGSLLDGKVRLGKDAQCSFALRVNLLSEGQDLLIGNVASARDDGKNNGARLFDIVSHHVLDQIDVFLCRDARGDVLKHSGDVNDSQVVFVRSTDLNAEDISAEGRASRIIVRARLDAHNLGSLVQDSVRDVFHEGPDWGV